MHIPPKIILIEGINGAGKDYVINEVLKEFGDFIRYIKFPNNPQIISQINYLYGLLPTMKHEEQFITLKIIHNLFDLDFRTFNFYKNDGGSLEPKKKFILLNRYYTSNLVYANLHKVWEPYWGENHLLTPIDFCFYLYVQEQEKSMYYQLMRNNVSTIPAYQDQITPDILYHEGQDLYRRLLWHEKEKGNIKLLMNVEALRENTIKNVKLAFMAVNH